MHVRIIFAKYSSYFNFKCCIKFLKKIQNIDPVVLNSPTVTYSYPFQDTAAITFIFFGQISCFTKADSPLFNPSFGRISAYAYRKLINLNYFESIDIAFFMKSINFNL